MLPVRQDSSFDISLRICSVSLIDRWFYSRAVHACWVFYWNPDSGAEIVSDGKKIVLTSRQAVLIPPFTLYSTMNRKSFRHFYIHFDAPSPYDRVARGVLPFPGMEVCKFFRDLKKCGDAPVFSVLLRRMLYHYLSEIPADRFLNPDEPVLDPRIQRAAEVMNHHLRNPLSNRELCRKAGMNLNGFYKAFQNELGMTPKKYLLQLRMEQARISLLHSDATIEEIAAGIGYADRFQFSKAFRQYYSVPPASFRNRSKI